MRCTYLWWIKAFYCDLCQLFVSYLNSYEKGSEIICFAKSLPNSFSWKNILYFHYALTHQLTSKLGLDPKKSYKKYSGPSCLTKSRPTYKLQLLKLVKSKKLCADLHTLQYRYCKVFSFKELEPSSFLSFSGYFLSSCS